MNGKLIVTEGGRDRIHELFDEQTIIGRGPNADLHLKSEAVSGAHCQIQATTRGFKVVDLESVEGTQVNGNFVNQHLLQNGDTIQVGDARITYLGDSAPPPRPARAAPPKPLTTHPQDPDGQPRRFYRHEQRNELSPGVKVVLVLAALSAVGLLLVMLNTTTVNEDGFIQYDEALKLSRQTSNPQSLKRAIALFKDLPGGVLDQREVDKLLRKAESDLFYLEKEIQDSSAKPEYQRITDYFSKHPDQLDYLERELRQFRSKYPGSGYTVLLEEKLQEVRANGAAGQERWAAAMAFLRDALKSENYAGAFKLIRELEQDPVMARAYGGALSTNRAAFERGLKDYYARMKAKALSLHEAGEVDRARQIYQGLYDIGEEPYSGQAKRLLESLR